jgi:hypothetical protein
VSATASARFPAESRLALDAAVGTLLDIEAIKTTKARYFRLLDAQAWNELEDVFTPDVQFFSNDVGQSSERPTTIGARAFIERAQRLLVGAVSTHHGHMPEIEVVGDSATAIWAMYDMVEHRSDPMMRFTGTGHYHDEYRRGTDGRWRISVSTLTRIRRGPLPATEDAA